MTAIEPENDDFSRTCIYVLCLVIAFTIVCFFLVILNSCQSPLLKEMARKDYIEVKHIAADDLIDVSKEIDKEYQESKKTDDQQKAS